MTLYVDDEKIITSDNPAVIIAYISQFIRKGHGSVFNVKRGERYE